MNGHEAWEGLYDPVRAAMAMTYPDGRPVPESALPIDGDEVWWGWYDESLDEPTN